MHVEGKIVDDILIWAPNIQELEDRLCAVIDRCDRLHVTLSQSKFQISSSLPGTTRSFPNFSVIRISGSP